MFFQKYIIFQDLPFRIKPINPIQKYPHIIESYASILQIFFMMFFFRMNSFNFFYNMVNNKAVKIYCIITIHIQSYRMSSY